MIETKKLKSIAAEQPFVNVFLENSGLLEILEDSAQNASKGGNPWDMNITEFLDSIPDDFFETRAISRDGMLQDFLEYMLMMQEFLEETETHVEKITIYPGQGKDGSAENFEKLELKKSEIISVVGPTGSGKSRLLADIEWMANADTPTKRIIHVNGQLPDPEMRFSAQNKLVAQLSQNMNFVMDLTAMEFLKLHAESRMTENPDEICEKIMITANNLAGEGFSPSTPITALSGGQSRALMIADTAFLSQSPIVLIDEIENAGIDRHRALDLLLSEEKIVLMATHDPALALMSQKRIVLKNGAISQIIETTDDERKILAHLEKIGQVVQSYRAALRQGKTLKPH